MRASFFPAALALLCLAGASGQAVSGDGVIYGHVARRGFEVTVSPMDAESRDADSAVLYRSRDPAKGWERTGTARKTGAEPPRFVATVAVPEDGVYYFTSRPVVGGSEIPPPESGLRTQAVIVVDTLPPIADILEPPDGTGPEAGGTLRLRWLARDENLAEKPSSLAYSRDGGASWTGMADGLPPAGRSDWPVPGDLLGPALLRLLAVDKAGNVGVAIREIDARGKTPPVSAPAVKTADAATGPAAKPEEKASGPETVSGPPQKAAANKGWIYYLFAVNMMRQNKPKDALQYYWLTVREDPEFTNAWADIALAYRELGAYGMARDALEKARALEPDRPDLIHMEGEIHHAEGMDRLTLARTGEDRMEAGKLVEKAVSLYAEALERARADWRLADQAATFYRLGEICYFVNLDKDGARAYWRKILDLHSPAPNPDFVIWAEEPEKRGVKKMNQQYTYARTSLETWQAWARGYLDQLDARERRGILDAAPAGPPPAKPSTPPAAGDYADTIGPGRSDGRSLFSLDSRYGSPGLVPEAAAYAGGSSAPHVRGAAVPRSGTSMFSPPDPAESRKRPLPDDPYVFPRAAEGDWRSAGPYGDKPGF